MTTLAALPGALVALALAAAGGGLVLLRARVGFGPLAMLVRALLGLALLAAFHRHVAVGITLAALVIGATWRTRPLEDAVLDDARPPSAIPYAAILVVVVAALLRPPVPLFAIESEGIALARAVSLGEVALLDGSRVLPVLASALALGSDALAPLTVGGTLVVVLSFALFALLVARSASSSFDEALPLVLLATTPFAWIHARAVSVDLAAGLLAGSLALAAGLAGKGDRLGAPAAITAALLLAMADQGIALAVAVTLALAMLEAPRGARRAALSAMGCLAIFALADRLAGVALDADARSIGPLAIEAIRHVSDVQTWGLVPAVGLAALASTLRRGAGVEARRLALTLGLALAMMFAVLVLAEVELRDQALEGALLDRLALSLLPLVSLLVARALAGPSPAAS